MVVINAIAELAGRWLKPGGRCAVEHDDTTSAATVEAFTAIGCFVDVTAQPGPGRSTPVRHRDTREGSRGRMTEIFDCADAGARATGIASAVSAVKGGRLVVLPTDTVYGIGADAFDNAAVAALLSAKGRGRNMPVPVLVGSWHTIEGLVYSVPDAARELIRAFWPGALSLVVQQAPSLQWDLGDARGHRDAADAVASGRHRGAARSRSDGGVEREHLRRRRRSPRRTRATNSAISSRSTSTAGPSATAGGVHDRRPHRRTTAHPAGRVR